MHLWIIKGFCAKRWMVPLNRDPKQAEGIVLGHATPTEIISPPDPLSLISPNLNKYKSLTAQI